MLVILSIEIVVFEVVKCSSLLNLDKEENESYMRLIEPIKITLE